MNYNQLYDIFPIIYDTVERYKVLRGLGNSRETVLDIINKENEQELQDEDDRFSVILGTAIALCRKNELTPEVMREAQALLEIKLQQQDEEQDSVRKILMALRGQISPEKLGAETHYPIRRIYKPDWVIGDTFIHRLTHPSAEEAHIQGWYVVFRKVGEYRDNKMNDIQIVYVTVCPPDKIPKTAKELNQLGVLRMMHHDAGWDYYGHIGFSSRKNEESWALTRIGNFPEIQVPVDATSEDPRFSMPLFGRLTKNDAQPDYEEFVCRTIRHNGIGK